VFIHTSNVIVTDLNTDDKWRAAKLEGKSAKPAKESKPAAPKPAPKSQSAKPKAAPKNDKDTKVAKPKKESK
ncbi:MAG: 50S ribosomal protein L24, partial [Candidatus Nitrosotenuis sp.]